MTGVLGITGKFASGPDGDPSPMDVVDFDAELTTVGFGSLLTGSCKKGEGLPWGSAQGFNSELQVEPVGCAARPYSRCGDLPSPG